MIYDIAVIGAGPAGTMAAIGASQIHKNVVLLERNNSIGKKILLTGKGRCNITNSASLEDFISQFGRQGQFLRSAFQAFSNQDLIDFFETRGLKMKIERQGRVFPETDRASSVVRILRGALLVAGTTVGAGITASVPMWCRESWRATGPFGVNYANLAWLNSQNLGNSCL